MGERERNQTYYDRNEGRFVNRDEQSSRDYGQERGSRDWEHRDEVRRSQGQGREYDPGNYNRERGYDSLRHQDESEFGARNFGAGYDPRRHANPYGGQRNDNDNRDGWQRQQQQNNEYRYGRDDHERTQHGGQPRQFDGAFGARLYGRDSSDTWNRFPPQERYPQREWGERAGYTTGYRGASQDDESFGQQVRDVSQQVVRKIKRTFRGPKGYKRTDERIREDLNDRLAHQDRLDPSDIEVSVANGEVTLTGTVQIRHEKFLAEEIADDVGGVTEIHNQLRVRREQQKEQGNAANDATPAGASTTDAGRNRNARA